MLQPSSLLLFLLWAESLAQSPIYWMIMDSNVTVVPGLSFFFPCQVYYPSYWREPLENNSVGEKRIYSYWYSAKHKVITDLPVAAREGDKEVLELTKNRFQMLGNPHSNDCSLMIRNPRKEDEGFYVYRIIQGLRAFTYSWHPLYIHVSDTLLPPDIAMPKILYSGVPSNVTCSVRWVTAWETDLIIAWKATASPQLGPRFNTSSILTITPVRADNGSSITCLVYFPDIKLQVEKTVRVLVSCDPQIAGSCDTAPEPKVVFHTLVEGALTGTGITIMLSSCLYLMYYVRTQRKEPMRAQRVKKKKVDQAPTGPTSTSISAESPVPSPEAHIVDTQSFKGAIPTMGQQEQFQPSITTSMPTPEKKTPSVEDVSTLPSLQLLPPTPPKLSRESSLVSSMRNSEEEIPSTITSIKNPKKKTTSIISRKTPEEKTSSITSRKNPEEETSSITSIKNPEEETSSITSRKNPEEKTSSITSIKNPEEETSSITSRKNPEEKTSSFITSTKNPEEEISMAKTK